MPYNPSIARDVAEALDRGDYRMAAEVLETHRTGIAQVDASKLTKTPTATGAGRALDTQFVISAVAPAMVSYEVDLSATSGLLSTGAAQVALTIDGNTVATAKLASQQLLGLTGVGIQTTAQQQLFWWVPAGSTVQLVSGTTGTATVALGSVVEIVFA